MIQVYFDDVLIDDDYYTGLSNSFNLFNEDFKLGSTASNSYTLSIAKEAVTKQPNKIILKEDDITIAVLEVDDIAEDDYSYTYTLTDKMIDLEFYYDASLIFKDGKTTLLSIVQNICNMAGIELATTNFRGSSKQISWYDNRRTAREYIGFVAELNGGYAQIGKDGKLYFLKQNTASVKNISIDDCADFEIGEKHKITRVVYELGTIKYEFGNETANTLYLNSDNVFITEESEVESIYNDIKDFEFYSFKTSNCPVDFNVIAGQIITFTDGTNIYPTITGYDLEYFGGWNGGYTLEIATKKQEETKVIGTSEKIKNLSIKVDRNQNSITSLVEETTTVITTIQDNIVNLQSQIDGSIQFWNGSDIPTASNYPASEWTTEEEKNKHRADIYTVIEDVDGELKQGKSYRFDKVGDTWQWIELTDNELSAVQALAQSKAKVFVTTPKVPYSIGDLWLNNGKLYECQVSKDASGSYSSTDWKEAVNYTDDTVANLAKTLANNAQSTADSAVEGVSNITNTTGQAEGKNIHIKDSAEEPLVDISLHGETKQETRSGKNLLDLSKSSFVRCKLNSDNKSITCNMTDYYFPCISTTQLNEWLLNNKGKTITFSIGTLLTGKYISIVIYGTRTNGQTVQEAAKISAESISITIAEDFTEITRLELRFNRTYETFTDTTTTISYAMIELGNEATEYEAYGAMPSPEFPSEIENVEGKNIFDKNTDNIIDKTFISSGLIKAEGASKVFYVKVKPKTTYIFSKIISYRFRMAEFTDEPTIGSSGINVVDKENITTFTFTTDSTTNYIAVWYYNSAGDTVTEQEILDSIQLEEGTVATPYAPYNSLEVKVERKNRLKNVATTTTINGITFTVNEDKSVTLFGTATADTNYYFYTTSNFLALKKGTYALSGVKGGSTTSYKMLVYKTDWTLLGQDIGSGVTFTLEEDTNVFIYIWVKNGTTVNTTVYPQIEEGTEPTDYEPYKSQTAYFPLAEGQKLMEGSYLADDGVHNKRGQVVLDGSSDEDWRLWSLNATNVERFFVNLTFNTGNINNSLCSHFKFMTEKEYFRWSGTSSGYHQFLIHIDKTKATTVAELKTWLSNNPITVEYELAEEEIVPYTEEQRKAWNKIKALTTYKNITNITSDAYAKIVYMRDNGLDVYETKQNAEKKYIETTEKFAEQKITVDGIQEIVSTTQTTVANNYQELKGKFDDYAPKSDVITLQTSVEKIQTDTYTKTEINTKLIDGSVEKVSTTAGTFDDNGLTIEKTNAKTKGNFNEKGITVTDATSGSSQELLFAGYDEELNETIVRSKNMTVEKYFVESNVARREEYSNPVLGGKGIGVFML